MSEELTDDEGRELDAAFFVRWLTAAAEAVDREADQLTELDSPIGDADHGGNMRRGFFAVRDALGSEPPGTPGAVLMLAGRTLVSTVGGASGPLYGTLLRRTGKALGDAGQVSEKELAGALRTGVDAVAQLAGASEGDKTMLDALLPAVGALSEGHGLAAASTAAERGAEATTPLQARKGRASYLGERSIGHQDPGATSSALLLAALAQTAALGVSGTEAENGTGAESGEAGRTANGGA
ncbi:dihydroxyacetone kinase subunit DhaL [Streptomyces iconiensis]|uniref:Dihydroxyacetone kinase subunit DhaL n=1 Tax=Streptomyces iconiensis TaxID=1384038 RepID=A0ABT6ZRJ7_9ACTN|nr:dihydroxyacetone kinase subunit DhaL [Streptomyces iconiensis]MDJ1131409.1 dihydroxyacetone kinase subunit DhaL [Streptomyces iconiensis]